MMKKIKFIVCILSIISGTMALSCVDEKITNENNPCSDSYEVVDSLHKTIGVIGFDETNQQYFINIYVEGTIDEIITAYPCELSGKFRTVNLNVMVNGDLFTSEKLPNPVIGGQKVFHINIKKIELIEN